MPKKSKTERILCMYVRLCRGHVINKGHEAVQYDVDERTIQRDIDDIRAFLAECMVGQVCEYREIEYDRSQSGFVMRGV